MRLIEVLILVGIVAVLILVSSCAGIDGPTTTPTPGQVLYRTVSKTNWLATAAIVGIAVSAFAFLNGNKMGIAGMVSCFIALSMTLAVARYATWLAAGGVIGSVGLLIYSIFVKDRALTEIIQGGELVKEHLKEWSNKEYATNEFAFKNIQAGAQSPTTEKIVKKGKGKINGKD